MKLVLIIWGVLSAVVAIVAIVPTVVLVWWEDRLNKQAKDRN